MSAARERSIGDDLIQGALNNADDGLYRLLVQTVQDYAIFALDPSGRIVTWNAGAQRLKGYTPDEIIGRHFSIFYPEEDVKGRKPEMELDVATRAGRVEDEGWRVRKDGSRFWANVVITALRDDAGELVGFAKVTRDLTDRRDAEISLRESEERFRMLVQEVKDYAIFMLDQSGHVTSWNDGAQRINGYTSSEILGKHFSTFYPLEDVAAGKTEMELEVAERDGRYEEEGWRIRKDGSRFWANVLITAVRDDRGELLGFAKVTRDLTERQAAQERRLADARRLAAAEAASSTRTEFLTAMSHELRTPINATLGYLDLMGLGLSGELDAQQEEYLDRIRRSQEHLLGIINDLLNYTRIGTGDIEYEIAPIEVAECVRRVLELVVPQATSKGIEIDSSQCDVHTMACADRAKVDQILLNLLTNAVKFTESGGEIEISCAPAAEWTEIVVTDTGVGISEEQLGTIFEPFVQLGRSLSSGHEGAGLGLSISRELARGMGGDLTATSTRGEGSRFILRLPDEASRT